MAYGNENQTYTASSGRVALLLVMIGSVVYAARLLHPKRDVLRNFVAANPLGWTSRLYPLWYPIVVATPLALLG